MPRRFGRRELFLTGTSTALAAVSLSGCDLLSTEPDGGKRSDGKPSDGEGANGSSAASRAKEAPMLAARVAAGELPPLAERLPSTPLVVRPVERVGRYGGTWTSALLGPGDTPWLDKTVQYDNLMRWKPDFSGVVPNIAASVDVVKDGREYVFHLRPGMRWSDGEPFTSADIVFAVRDILLNADVSPVPPGWLVADDTPVTVDAPDETTVRFTFRRPMGLFLQNLASLVGTPLTTCPRHYLEKFHQKYDENATPAAKDAGFSDWTELLAAKRSSTENPELPNLFAWVHRTALGDSNRMIAERNPYYWKTDPDGRQLPYIDKVVFDIVENDQVILLKATNGEFGLHARHINTLRNKPVLAKNRERGKYGFFELVPSIMNDMLVQLNLAHEDEKMRRIFQNRDFRIGLSYAIDRADLIKAVMQGQGEPWQAAPRRESPFFDERLAKQYTEFDPKKAERHLDRAGLRKRDREGFRLREDGKRLHFRIEVPTPSIKDFWADAAELVKRYWAQVGISVEVKSEDRSLFYERKDANEHDAVVWQGPGGLQDAIMDPRCYFPFSSESGYATPWAAWFTSRGKSGAEPPDAAKKQMQLYRQLEATIDEAEQHRLFREILAIAREQFWVIGTVQPTQGYGIVANSFHNVPKSMPDANVFATPGPTNPEQYFIGE